MHSTPLTFTRVINACVLIEVGEHSILTDPFFQNWRIIGIKEDVAIAPRELPRLTAIIGCHAFIDHWQMAGLADYPHNKADVQVFVAMNSMARSARKAGFRNVEVLNWGECRAVGEELSIEAVQAQRMLFWTVNNYVLRCGDVSVFFGREALDLKPLAESQTIRGPIDVAALPVNAVHLFGLYKLVMSGGEAAHAASAPLTCSSFTMPHPNSSAMAITV
ncbi:MAG: hypothetical protein AAF557_13565 [Pseudomonadota bacterium]